MHKFINAITKIINILLYFFLKIKSFFSLEFHSLLKKNYRLRGIEKQKH